MYYTRQWIGTESKNFAPWASKKKAITQAERLLANELVGKVEIIEAPNKFGEGKEVVVSTIFRG